MPGEHVLLRKFDGTRLPLGGVKTRRYKPDRPGRVLRGPDAAAHLFAAET